MTTLTRSIFLAILLTSGLAFAQGTYTQIDYPEASGTVAEAVDSAGDIVGHYLDAAGANHGFLLSGGNFTTIDDPTSSNTLLEGINNARKIAGIGVDEQGLTHGFIYDLVSETFENINPPGTTNGFANGINDAGIVVGGTQMGPRNIAYKFNGTKYLTLDIPDAQPTKINNHGVVVGSATIATGQISFIFANGKYRQFNLPGATSTGIQGLNDNGQIVGFYFPNIFFYGFVYQSGSFQTLIFDGNETAATDISDSGEVVGYFYDVFQKIHGFTWTPPVPAHRESQP